MGSYQTRTKRRQTICSELCAVVMLHLIHTWLHCRDSRLSQQRALWDGSQGSQELESTVTDCIDLHQVNVAHLPGATLDPIYQL